MTMPTPTPTPTTSTSPAIPEDALDLDALVHRPLAAPECIGYIKGVEYKRGFGFLVDKSTGQDRFFHFTNVTGAHPVFMTLAEGQKVRFNPIVGERGPRAANVTPLSPPPESV